VAATLDDWIEIFGGRVVWIEAPELGRFTIEAVAYGLAGEWRFSGQTKPRLSVAEHCVRMADLAARDGRGPRFQMLALLHDAAEGVGLRDVPSPVKRHLAGYADLERRWHKAILADLGIAPPTADECVVLKTYDEVMLVTEARRLGLKWWLYGVSAEPDSRVQIACWPPKEAEARFLGAYRRFAEVLKCTSNTK